MNSNEGKEKNIVGVFAEDAKLPYGNIGMELSYKLLPRAYMNSKTIAVPVRTWEKVYKLSNH